MTMDSGNTHCGENIVWMFTAILQVLIAICISWIAPIEIDEVEQSASNSRSRHN